MANLPSHDEFQNELIRRGLPRAYIERLLAELDDHFTDILEERSTSMGAARKLHFDDDEAKSNASIVAAARIGEPTQLAIFAADEYRARSFWGRHPFVTFVVAPLPTMVAVLIGYLAALWLILAGLGVILEWFNVLSVNEHEHPWVQAIALTFFSWGFQVVPPLATALVLCRIYRRNALPVRWPILGCVLLSVVITVIQTQWRLATGPSESDRGMLMFGFLLGTSLKAFTTVYLPRFAIAMGIGLLLVKRAQQKMAADGLELVND
jgi:hypothetical protein